MSKDLLKKHSFYFVRKTFDTINVWTEKLHEKRYYTYYLFFTTSFTSLSILKDVPNLKTLKAIRLVVVLLTVNVKSLWVR